MSDERYLVTEKGHAQLLKQLKHILLVERPKNVQDIEEARAHGDLSENAEYHAAKERQGLLDAEKRLIEDRLGRAQKVDPTKLSGDKVVFGGTVTLCNSDTEEEVVYQLVGEHEADLKEGRINYRSPLARGMMGKEIGDEFDFKAPGGTRTYEIVDIEFV
jgi:transcription elongation factor GreA